MGRLRPFTFEDYLGFSYVVGFIVLLALVVAGTKLPRALKRLIYAGLALRVIGGVLRYLVFFVVYAGSGDAPGYYRRGVVWSEMMFNGDFSFLWDETLWFRERWNETGFVHFPSTAVIALIGPSMIGEFVAFSLLAFLGIVGFAVAFRRAYPDIPLNRYARWVFLFPSLWYWPSSVGKEALIMMGIGLAVWGFIGKNERIQWIPLLIGTFFVWAIRPQVSAVLMFSFVVAHWLSLGKRWTPSKAAQGVAILVAGVIGMRLATQAMGIEEFGIEGVQEYMESESASRSVRGSTLDQVGLNITGVPMAIINVLTRPWPWEATSSTAFLSALELMMLWGICWYRRKNLMQAIRSWRSHAVLRIAVPFIFVYAMSLGLLVVNMGIIARQRVFIFPFIFFFLEAVPAVRRRRGVAVPPQQVRVEAPPPHFVREPVR